MTQTLDKEIRFLLLCSSTRQTEEEKSMIRSLAQEAIDWDKLLRLAAHHRLLPLLYRTLSTECPKLVPENILHTLRQFYKNNGTRNFLMTGTIIQISTLCEANNIQTLAVKGPLLAQSIYGDIGLRSFGDIDILVADNDIDKTVDLLLTKEYSLSPENIPKGLFLKFLKTNHDGRLRSDKGFIFELHRDLADWYTPKEMTLKSIGQHIKQTNLLDHTVNDLRPEFLLAYLALHGNKHGWIHLEQLCCIAELLRKEQGLNWTLLFEIAKEYKIKRRLLLTLRLIQLLFASELPENVCQQTAEKEINTLAEGILLEIVSPKVLNKERERFRDKARYHRKLMDRTCDLISFLIKGLTVPSTDDWECLAIPCPFFPLYYLYKPFRIIFTAHTQNG